MDGESFERQAGWEGQFWNCWGAGEMEDDLSARGKIH